MNVALIVFAGLGTRINSSVPKQFIKINGKEMVLYTIDVFQNHPEIDEIILVTHPNYYDFVKSLVEQYNLSKVKHIVKGGATRQESVKFGLLETNYDDKDNVLIHDGDRPLVSKEIISENIRSLTRYSAVCTMIKHEDSLREVSNLGRTKKINGEDIDVQTPQSFKYGIIKKYHVLKENEQFSDDIGLIENDYEVCYIKGDKYNFKVTTDIDLKYIEKLL